jgi:hypothetical protein
MVAKKLMASRRMITMTSHIERCGERWANQSSISINLLPSLEQSVMPQVRRFNELEVEGTTNEISLLEPI